MRKPQSLRALLLCLVGTSLFLLMLIETAVSYRIGLHTADQVFDRWLLDSVDSLAQEVRYENGAVRFVADATAIEVLEWDALDEVYYRVATQEGELIAGSAVLPPVSDVVLPRNEPLFQDLELNGENVRSVSMLLFPDTSQPVTVTVAETLNKRMALTGDLLFEVLLSKSLLLIAILLMVAVTLNLGLRPLRQLARELGQRSSRDLTPIKLQKPPLELRGLVDTTNSLLARLDAALSAREQFIGNIAHQTKTPLAGIKLHAQLALQDDDPQFARATLERIAGVMDDMAHVNSQLLKLARAETACGRGLQLAPVDLTAVAQRCREALVAQAAQKQITLTLRLPERPAIVAGDTALLGQLMSNLIENAILYGNVGGRVMIAIDAAPNQVRFQIEDDGPGIPREHWPKIFDRFYRPFPELGRGCGLGLPIVREIALAHDSEVTLDEPASGRGARFVITFRAFDSRPARLPLSIRPSLIRQIMEY